MKERNLEEIFEDHSGLKAKNYYTNKCHIEIYSNEYVNYQSLKNFGFFFHRSIT